MKPVQANPQIIARKRDEEIKSLFFPALFFLHVTSILIKFFIFPQTIYFFDYFILRVLRCENVGQRNNKYKRTFQ